MSEELNRRQFLTALISLAGTALFAQEKQDTLIPALKEYITAQQDVKLKHATEIPAQTRANLESRLAENGLDKAVAEQLEQQKPAPALTTYFESKNLAFRLIDYNTHFAYELVRVTPAEKRTIQIGEHKFAIPFRDLVEDIIPHIVHQIADTKGRRALLGGMLTGANVVEMRPAAVKDRARFYYDDHTANEAAIEAQLAKPDFLDQFLESSLFTNPDAPPKLKPEFWKALDAQLRHRDMRERYDLKTGRDAVVGQLEKDITAYVGVHEAIHYLDMVTQDWSFLNDLDRKLLTELQTITRPHSEARAYLGAMAYGYARPVLAHVAYRLSDGSDRSDPNYAGGEILFKTLARAVATNGKKYGVSAVTSFDVYKRLPALTEKQLQEASAESLLRLYKGRSLRDYIKDFLPEKR
jgi:hypothetical protein